jgi:hypothetical protein
LGGQPLLGVDVRVWSLQACAFCIEKIKFWLQNATEGGVKMSFMRLNVLCRMIVMVSVMTLVGMQSALADTSVCQIFVVDREVYTTCDGKQLESTIKMDNGSVIAITKAIQRLLLKGYKLQTCTGENSDRDCFLTK